MVVHAGYGGGDIAKKTIHNPLMSVMIATFTTRRKKIINEIFTSFF